MKKVLVTGATGFVGARLVPLLLDKGYDVRVFVRDAARLKSDVRDRVEIVTGSLEDDRAVDRAVSGCSRVMHLAATAKAYVRDPRSYFRVNTDAVAALLEASARAGVVRFVQVSSVLALPPVSRASAWGIPARPTVYGQSKRAAEILVRNYVADGHDAVIVRPSRIYGPGPWNDANGTTRLIAMYLEGKIRFRLADHHVEANYVHVDDVAEGIILAASHGLRGRAYVLGGENASVADFLGTVADLSGIRRHLVPVAPQLIMPVACLGTLWGWCGGNTSITPAWLNNFLEHRPQEMGASRADLGYAPRSLREGVSQTLNWLHGVGGGEQNVYRNHHDFQKSGA